MISFKKLLEQTSMGHDNTHIKIANDVVRDFLESEEGNSFAKELEDTPTPTTNTEE